MFKFLPQDLSKAIIDIAYALNHSKDMKDLFVDLSEAVIFFTFYFTKHVDLFSGLIF